MPATDELVFPRRENASSEFSYLEAPIQRLGNIDVAPGRHLGSGATGSKAFGTCPANFQPVKLGSQHRLKIRAIGKFLLTSLYGRDDKTI